MNCLCWRRRRQGTGALEDLPTSVSLEEEPCTGSSLAGWRLPKCRKCSLHHRSSECPGDLPNRCANCGEADRSTYRGCEYYQFATQQQIKRPGGPSPKTSGNATLASTCSPNRPAPYSWPPREEIKFPKARNSPFKGVRVALNNFWHLLLSCVLLLCVVCVLQSC